MYRFSHLSFRLSGSAPEHGTEQSLFSCLLVLPTAQDVVIVLYNLYKLLLDLVAVYTSSCIIHYMNTAMHAATCLLYFTY